MCGNMQFVNISSSDKRNDRLLLWVLIAFTLFFRLYMLQMINVGPDEIDYWFSGKRLAGPGSYPELMHRTIRWAIILPVAFFQWLLGSHVLVYYITPILNSIIQTVLLYRLGKRIFNQSIAFYAVILCTAWPYMWRTGSQIRPAIFSITYVLVALYFLFLYLDSTNNSKQARFYLLASAAALFIAYQSKITNLYFVPGILVVLWLHRRKLSAPLLFGLTLFGLYVIEHMAYFISVGDPFGRLGIIARNHLSSSYAEELPSSFLGLFQRYTVFLEFPWHLLLLAFVASTVFLLIRKRKWICELTILHAGFFFFLTFMVKSIDPVVPVEAFLDRYFIATLPTMSLVIVYALFEVFPLSWVVAVSQRRMLVLAAVCIAVVALIVTALPLPAGVERFYTPFSKLHEHPIPRVLQFEEDMEMALMKDLPIVSVDSAKPLDAANRIFYDDPREERYARPIKVLKLNEHNLYYLDGVGGAPQRLDLQNGYTRVLYCDRFNFSMDRMQLNEISKLGEVYE